MTISDGGCGLCSLTVVADSINGTSYDPKQMGDKIGWTGPLLLSETASKLRSLRNRCKRY